MLYTSCMNTGRIEERAAGPLLTLLEEMVGHFWLTVRNGGSCLVMTRVNILGPVLGRSILLTGGLAGS